MGSDSKDRTAALKEIEDRDQADVTLRKTNLNKKLKTSKNLYQRSQFTEMIFPCEIPQPDIPDVSRNHIL